jgi:predicted SnoaL-like aldol condensation-catalyzing enzyme
MPTTIAKGKRKNKEDPDRKKIATGFFRLLMQGKVKDGLRFFAIDCKQHNPYVSGSMDALTDAMISAGEKMAEEEPGGELTIEHVLGDGDMVAVHTQIVSPGPRPHGMRQVHLFRFRGDKIVEYWDITQQIPAKLPNAMGAF